MLKRLVTLLLCALVAAPLPLPATDVLVPAVSRYVVLGRGLLWAGSGFGGFNNNFIFTPQDPDQGLCLFVVNNDSGSHSFTFAVSQTGDPNAASPAAAPSRWSAVKTFGTPTPVAGNSTGSFYARTQAAARVAVQLASGTGAGTADLFAVQTTSVQGCSSALLAVQGQVANGAALSTAGVNPLVIGGQVPGSPSTAGWYGVGAASGAGTGFPLATTGGSYSVTRKLGNQTQLSGDGGIPLLTVIQWTRCGTGQLCIQTDTQQDYESASREAGAVTWTVNNKLTNPTANQNLLSLAATGGGSAILAEYKTAYLDCSATCEILVSRITTVGTTCATETPVNTYLPNGAAYAGGFTGGSGAIQSACTTNPTTAGTLFDVTLNAGSPQIIDLRGLISNFGTVGNPSGLMFQVVTGFTGNATISVQWGEF